MDPLSVTAGIIAIFQAGGTLSNGLKKIISLKNAPDILLALSNEVADIQGVLEDVDSLLQEHLEITGTEPVTSIGRVLEKLKSTLLKLQSLLAYKLTTVKGPGNELRLDRSVWLQLEGEVRELKDEIRGDKVSLSSALSILNSSISLRGYAQLQGVSVSLHAMRIHSPMGDNSACEHALPVAYDITDIPERSLVRVPHATQTQRDTETGSDAVLQLSSALDELQVAPATVAVELASQKDDEQPSATTFEMFRNSCGPDCNCSCHKHVRFESPGFLDAVFGSLFVGYSASPWSSQGCKNVRCRGRSTRIQYVFPRWFVHRALAITIACRQPKGPEVVLRIFNLRPGDAYIFDCVMRGFDAEVKRLLANGEASVFDVTPNNFTLLHVALNYNQIDTAELLIRAGSDKFQESNAKSSPYTLAWERLLGTSQSNRNMRRLRGLFPGDTQLDLLQFSELHTAILGISGRTLDSVLSSSLRSSIDIKDAHGRTTLSWAAQQGDAEGVNRLLCCGADPNSSDSNGWSPLHWSLDAENSTCMELLLDSKADVGLKDVLGLTVLSFAAWLGADMTFVDILLEFGGDIESQNNEGKRPLHLATERNKKYTVAGLLERGADINAKPLNGMTALHLALFNDSHEVLKILLDNADLHYNVSGEHGRTLLHYAALFADIGTLDILKRKRLDGLDSTKVDVDGWTPEYYAQWRRHFNDSWARWAKKPRDLDTEEWYSAFEELLDSVDDAQYSRTETDVSEEDEDEDEDDDEDEDKNEVEDGEFWQDAPEQPVGVLA